MSVHQCSEASTAQLQRTTAQLQRTTAQLQRDYNAITTRVQCGYTHYEYNAIHALQRLQRITTHYNAITRITSTMRFTHHNDYIAVTTRLQRNYSAITQLQCQLARAFVHERASFDWPRHRIGTTSLEDNASVPREPVHDMKQSFGTGLSSVSTCDQSGTAP
jgi:hypothetical protein